MTGGLLERSASVVRLPQDLGEEPLALIERLGAELRGSSGLSLEIEAGPEPRGGAVVALLRLSGWKSEGETSSHGQRFRPRDPHLSLGRVRDSDQKALLGLFERAFGHPITEAQWQWKYGGGRGHSILARTETGVVFAHYGASARTLMDQGQRVEGLQVGDVMIDPSWQGPSGRSGPFFRLAAAFQTLFYDYHRDHRWAYGFPNARALRLAVRQRLYRPVDQILEVRWAPIQGFWAKRLEVIPRGAEVLETRRFQVLVEEMHQDLRDRLLVLRDPNYLRYRYLDHPCHRYPLLEVRHRLNRQSLGFAFIRQEPERIRLMDVIGRIKHIPAIIEALRGAIQPHGDQPLEAWITRGQEEFFGKGGTIRSTGLDIPCQALRTPDGPSPDGRWWISFGDTDFL